MTEKNKGGRPPMFSSKEDLQHLIDDYFKNPPMKTIVTKEGVPIEVPAITITGLALHLGFIDRQSLYDYEKKEEFTCTIKRARTFVENNYEIMLSHGNTTGAIFALKNMGWSDKQQVDNISSDGSMSPSEIPAAERLKDLLDGIAERGRKTS